LKKSTDTDAKSLGRLKFQQPAKSVDHRSSGRVATDGKASILGRMPIARLRTCQPRIWKIL
jgi:hypothetical protein